MALRTASTAMARVERPEPREYSVSPTPTMQYLSLSVFIATGRLLWLRGSEQAAERAEVEIEVSGGKAEALADVADRVLEPHERAPHVLGLLGREAAGLHAADRLALHQLAQELDEREHEPRDRALHAATRARGRAPMRGLSGRPRGGAVSSERLGRERVRRPRPRGHHAHGHGVADALDGAPVRGARAAIDQVIDAREQRRRLVARDALRPHQGVQR